MFLFDSLHGRSFLADFIHVCLEKVALLWDVDRTQVLDFLLHLIMALLSITANVYFVSRNELIRLIEHHEWVFWIEVTADHLACGALSIAVLSLQRRIVSNQESIEDAHLALLQTHEVVRWAVVVC